jgi:hypothetical protein
MRNRLALAPALAGITAARKGRDVLQGGKGKDTEKQ